MVNVLFCKWDDLSLHAVLNQGGAVHMIVDDLDVKWLPMPKETLARLASVHQVRSMDSLEELSGLLVTLALEDVKVDRVANTGEHLQHGAAFLTEGLGLEPDAIVRTRLVRDKRAMKEKVAAAGVPVARFASVRSWGPDDQLARAVDAVGLPLVIKPSNGFATMSTIRVTDADELRRIVDDFDYASSLLARDLMLEENLSGDEYHVDAVWRDGEPWMFSVSRYFCPRLQLTETGGLNGSVALPEAEHADLYARLREMHQTVNLALGISAGATHLEVFHDPATDDLRFGEIATRVAGGAIPEQVGASCGTSIRDAWAAELVGKLREDLNWRPSAKPYVGWINIEAPRAGLITSVPSREELLADPRILDVVYGRGEGDRIGAGHPSNWVVMPVFGADSWEEATSIAEELQRTLHVEVVDVPAEPEAGQE